VEIKEQYLSGAIKTQHLEAVVFEDVYQSQREKLAEACADAASIRREMLEEHTGVKMPVVGGTKLDSCTLTKDGTVLTGIENKIGSALVPLGFAGPVKINGDFAKGDYYLPLATNEAALIAGTQRGVKAINLSGGLTTIVTFDGMTRAPMVEAPSLARGRDMINALADEAYIADLGKLCKDPFVRLTGIDTYQVGTKIFLRMFYKTGDAMGMNGCTKASADITKAIMERFSDFTLISITSNLCSDKKSNHINILTGRGKTVHATVFIPEEVLGKVFRAGVTSRKVEKLVFNKCYLGSAFSGTMGGYNVNTANALAAFYMATGQDLAHVVSSSSSFLQAEAVGDGLLVQGFYPQLEVAAMGGGTMFGTAKEMLRMLGCDKVGSSLDDNTSVKKVAEIAAACAMALDINTTCTQAAAYELAEGHVRLARGEKD